MSYKVTVVHVYPHSSIPGVEEHPCSTKQEAEDVRRYFEASGERLVWVIQRLR